MFKKAVFLFLTFYFMHLPLSHAAQYVEDDIHGKTGFEESRTYEGITAQENIDPFSGNLIFTLPLFSFPGKGGLDLNLTLIYNSKVRKISQASQPLIPWDYMGLGWSLHLARAKDPRGTASLPVIVMPDGSEHVVFPDQDMIAYDSGANWKTKEFWKYEITSISGDDWAILTLTNGTQYKFRISGTWNGQLVPSALWYPVEEIEDTSGNKIAITNTFEDASPGYYAFFIDSIKDSYNRTISFDYFTQSFKNEGLKSIGNVQKLWQIRS